jgi:hypothetical protein
MVICFFQILVQVWVQAAHKQAEQIPVDKADRLARNRLRQRTQLKTGINEWFS